MSEPEACHSSFAESSNLFDYLNREQTHIGSGKNDGPGRKVIEKQVTDGIRNNNVEQFAQSETGREEVMDAEVSSITCKKGSPSIGESIALPLEQNIDKEKELDQTPSSGRTSNDIDVAALSPCFPLIRDKEDFLETSCDHGSNNSDNFEYNNEKTGIEIRTNSEAKDKCSNERNVQNELLDKVDTGTNNHAKLKGSFESEDNESRGINIVSSSLDKKNFISEDVSCDDKMSSSPKADICDSSREPPQSTEDEDVNKSKSGDSSDDDNSGEASGDISFVSSLEDDDEQEPAPFNQITENFYLIDKKKTRLNKEIRRIRCDCVYEPDEPGFVGCGSSCLNRLLMIECGNKCGCGEFCTNKNFQRGCAYDLEVFRAGKKGWGVKTNEPIDAGVFIIEYCGEVVNYKEFMERTETYDLEKRKHYYFMLLKGDEVIDATRSGSISRFINHSCDPNCVTQKWTVNGFLRVGFFSLREIQAGEELNFDYQYQRYGEKAQKCFCGSAHCRGVIGGKQMVLKPTGSSGESSKRRSKKKTSDYEADCKLEDDISDLLGDENKISTSKQALELTRLMVKTETIDDRITLLKIVRNQSDSKALKAFIRYKGLSLLWSWMVDTPAKDMVFRSEVLNTLKILPIPNKNHLVDSKILPLVEKWSRCNDSPDSCTTRSDEDGSSSENETGGADGKRESDTEKKKTEKSSKNSTETKNTSTDEESDNSEKQEIVGSMANELLDNWKHLREVFKIPKKTQLTPEQPKQNTEASSSPVDEKRNGKRKIEGDKTHRMFSPNKRPFGSLPGQKTQSPLTVFPQDPSTSPFRPESPSVSTATSSTGLQSCPTDAGDTSQPKESPQPPKASLIQRLLRITSEPREEDPQSDERRNVDRKPYAEDIKPLRGRVWSPRGTNNAPFRGSPQPLEEFGPDRLHFRGSRGSRGRARGRGRANSHQFGRLQLPFAEGPEQQQIAGVNNTFVKRDGDLGLGREFPGTGGMAFHQDANRMPNDGNRIPAPYSYQALVKPHRDRPVHPRDNVHLERQQNIHNERHDAAAAVPRFPLMRHPRPNLNRFGKPGQEWQAPGSPFNTFQGQAQQGFNPARMPPTMNPNINPSTAPPPHFGTPPLSSQPPLAPQPPLSSQLPLTSQPPPLSSHPPPQNLPPQANPVQNWNQSWPVPPRQGFPPQNLPHPPVNHPVGLVNRPPAVPNSNPAPVPPFPFNPERMPSQPMVQSQQQPPPFFDSPQPSQVLASLPPKPFIQNTAHEQSQATTVSIIKHLHELAQQSKLATAQQQQQQQQQQEQKQQMKPIQQIPPVQKPQVDQVDAYGQTTPETGVDNGISFVTPVKEKRESRKSLGTPEVTESSKTVSSLPPNWKTATDPEGKVYYYHVVTRKTQWDIPKWENEESAKQLNQRKTSSVVAGPRTPPASPPHSPISPALYSERPQAISDPSVSTTRISAGHSSGQTEQLNPKQQKIRDVFKAKLSAVVVNCLNPYQKVDCKQARISKIEDFKFLARKLTHGLMMKELARVKSDEELECTDSVKIKVKEYIRNYMRKFGQFYIRS